MPDPAFFRINAPLVAVQEIEGEAILINFDTGCYYCANATGAVLLDLVQRGESVLAMGAALAERCGVAEATVAEAVSAFLAEALAGGLIVAGVSAVSVDGGTAAGPASVAALTYVEPQLEKFDDLQDLLMLDPIHDVDQAGWPMQAPNPDTGTPNSPA